MDNATTLDSCSNHTAILRLGRFLVRDGLAASLQGRDEETEHENNTDETLHGDKKQVSKLMIIC